MKTERWRLFILCEFLLRLLLFLSNEGATTSDSEFHKTNSGRNISDKQSMDNEWYFHVHVSQVYC